MSSRILIGGMGWLQKLVLLGEISSYSLRNKELGETIYWDVIHPTAIGKWSLKDVPCPGWL